MNKTVILAAGAAIVLAGAGIAVNAATLNAVPQGDIGQAPDLLVPSGSPMPTPSPTPTPTSSPSHHPANGGVDDTPADDHGGPSGHSGSGSGGSGSSGSGSGGSGGSGDDHGGSGGGGGHGSDD